MASIVKVLRERAAVVVAVSRGWIRKMIQREEWRWEKMRGAVDEREWQ
jgi:hypothetical protein